MVTGMSSSLPGAKENKSLVAVVLLHLSHTYDTSRAMMRASLIILQRVPSLTEIPSEVFSSNPTPKFAPVPSEDNLILKSPELVLLSRREASELLTFGQCSSKYHKRDERCVFAAQLPHVILFPGNVQE
jgi:hypothetical protein